MNRPTQADLDRAVEKYEYCVDRARDARKRGRVFMFTGWTRAAEQASITEYDVAAALAEYMRDERDAAAERLGDEMRDGGGQ